MTTDEEDRASFELADKLLEKVDPDDLKGWSNVLSYANAQKQKRPPEPVKRHIDTPIPQLIEQAATVCMPRYAKRQPSIAMKWPIGSANLTKL